LPLFLSSLAMTGGTHVLVVFNLIPLLVPVAAGSPWPPQTGRTPQGPCGRSSTGHRSGALPPPPPSPPAPSAPMATSSTALLPAASSSSLPTDGQWCQAAVTRRSEHLWPVGLRRAPVASARRWNRTPHAGDDEDLTASRMNRIEVKK
jgi:hypothetical protein